MPVDDALLAARWSLRQRLLALLLGLTVLLWGGCAAIVYVQASQESQELFDQSMAETAHLLLSLAEQETREHGAAGMIDLKILAHSPRSHYLRFQIRDSAQRLMYANGGTEFNSPQPDGFAWTAIDGRRCRVYSVWNDKRDVQVQVAEPIGHREEIGAKFFFNIAGLTALLAAVGGLGIWVAVQRLFRVLRDSADAVAARTPNDLAEVSAAQAPREVYPLLLAINRLFGRVRREMENQQRFTADAAHELRTPLAAIKTNLQVMQRARSNEEREEFIAGLDASVERASRLVGQLLTLARLDPQDHLGTLGQRIDLAQLLQDEYPYWKTMAHGRSLQLDAQAAWCEAEPDSLRILLQNLVDNALRYTPAPGAIAIRCGVRDGRSFLEVADQGPGIPPSMREQVFERFVRLAGAEKPGSGLGLSIVQRIAELHRASIAIGAGAEGRGAVVTLTFPAGRE